MRRLLRRAIRYFDLLKMKEEGLVEIAKEVVKKYQTVYKNVSDSSDLIVGEIKKEESKFRETLARGLKIFENHIKSGDFSAGLSGVSAFEMVTTYGFPRELIEDLAKERNIEVDWVEFEEEMKKHQELSRAGSEQKFKGGLADTSEISIKYHTATHLLHAALREVLGDDVLQKGSNITPERLRFDFSHDAKMTDEEKKEVESIVNQKIKESLPVICEEMKIGEAKETGALGVFGEKYGEAVKVYKIGNEKKGIFSMELCGGPHIDNTDKLGHFKITKEEAVSAGVRRIKAVLEFSA